VETNQNSKKAYQIFFHAGRVAEVIKI